MDVSEPKMAVQIARIDDDRLLIDTVTFGKILYKAGNMPVAVVAVYGTMDNNRSSLINQILKYLTSSKDNEDASNKTTAEPLWSSMGDYQNNEILVWPEPLMISSVAVLLMEIRGCQTSMANSLILSFGCLLSSVMIYNVQNDISEDILKFLHMSVANAKFVNKLDEHDNFGKLLFVINNWELIPDYYGFGLHGDMGSPSPRNFKKEKFDIQQSFRPEHLVVRKEILSSFQDVTCCLMQQNMDIDNEVFQHVNQWLFTTVNNISKKVKGTEVTGIEYKALMDTWAGLYSNLKIQSTRSVEDGISEVQISMAYTVALKYFKNEMTASIHMFSHLSDDQLRQVHSKKKQKTVDMFERMILNTNDQNTKQKYRTMLNQEIQGSLCSHLNLKAEDRTFNPGQIMEVTEVVAVQQKSNGVICLKYVCLALVLVKIILAISILVYRHATV